MSSSSTATRIAGAGRWTGRTSSVTWRTTWCSTPATARSLLVACKTGHLGPTVFRSEDLGRGWVEASRPPAFPKVPEGESGRVVDHVFWLQPGLPDEPGVWYAGTSPPALFRSEDGGDRWAPVSGWNDHPQWGAWTEEGDDGTPDGSILHSINVDPRDPAHLYIGLSGGGVFESPDAGASWAPLNRGCAADFHPEPDPEYGHDPHCVRLHPAAPDVLWQQNHCGIYRMDADPRRVWERVGDQMPREVGDIGFPIELHPRDPRRGLGLPHGWHRCLASHQPRAADRQSTCTRDAGRSWQRRDGGLPPENAWLTVLRQAMAVDAHDPVGVYFGTTTGQLWASRDEGDRWERIAEHLPHVYSVEVAELAP